MSNNPINRLDIPHAFRLGSRNATADSAWRVHVYLLLGRNSTDHHAIHVWRTCGAGYFDPGRRVVFFPLGKLPHEISGHRLREAIVRHADGFVRIAERYYTGMPAGELRDVEWCLRGLFKVCIDEVRVLEEEEAS